MTLHPGTRVTAPLGRPGTIFKPSSATAPGCALVILDADPGHPTLIPLRDLTAHQPPADENGRRQAKIAKLVHTLEHDLNGRPWADLHRLLAALPDDHAAAWWHLAASKANVRPPSPETVRLTLAHIATLAAHENDPFRGLPR